MAIITVRNLLKRYNSAIAVDNIDLNIEAGEVFGFLGPNGAGKSTTINIICGLLKADQGEITLDSIDLRRNPREVKKRIGLVPQEIALFDTLTAQENLKFFARLAGLRGKLLTERVAEALEFVGLGDKGPGLVKSFSGGMKRRLNIACAIVHRPKIIIMDEPTVGIDPQSRNHILQSVRLLNHLGSTIIYTSHYMEEVEAVCSRIAIMDHGRLIACGTTQELRDLIACEEKILIQVLDSSYSSFSEIKRLPGVKGVQYSGNQLEIITPSAQTVLQDALFTLSKSGVRVKGVTLQEADLETVFLSLTGRKLRD